MRILLSYPTKDGVFDIGQSNDRRYHIIFNDESLGDYDSIQKAVDDLVINKSFTLYNIETKEKINISELNIPSDYTQWDTY